MSSLSASKLSDEAVLQHLFCFDRSLAVRGFSQTFISALHDQFIQAVGQPLPSALRLFFVTRFFRKVVYNRIAIHMPSHHVCGTGIYPLASLINHSCLPNACFVFAGNELLVRTLAPIPAGAEITVSYVDNQRVAPVRHAHLLQAHDFLCRCAVCSVGDEVRRETKGADAAAWEDERMRMGVRCTRRCGGVMVPSLLSLDAMPCDDEREG